MSPGPRGPKRHISFLRSLNAKEEKKIGPCECDAPLAVYTLRETWGAEPARNNSKALICCTRPKCSNSAGSTARIHGATLEKSELKSPTPSTQQEGLAL